MSCVPNCAQLSFCLAGWLAEWLAGWLALSHFSQARRPSSAPPLDIFQALAAAALIHEEDFNSVGKFQRSNQRWACTRRTNNSNT
eukprot:446844-Hanusia_phi.AAC.1